ncbi:DUF1217 domain-containing protein [Citreicella sp. C3M06]|uniref:DUF1217 domain-containing protein n=1 Tax=Citreicella sp. C3M06 TaxID=2841564 RepID=UPI001C0A57A2|nr:DUF1217 domain-containing protein [Citreicella sp. C3M06]MBU2959571.1 DUF1217 domain-containing protein [Citreicella sp. C3M06]
MSYTPTIAGSGLVGWQMLQATMSSQQAAFNNSAEITRETNYFQEKIGSISSAEELVNDRRLLSVALSAFGMSEEIDSKYLIQRIIQEGADDDSSLANRLGDSRYITLAQTFDFEPVTKHRTQEEGFGEAIFSTYEGKMRSELEATLQQPQYEDDPLYAAVFEAQVTSNIEDMREYFLDNIKSIESVEDLLNDHDLTSIVLKAFDLEDRAGSTTILKRILSEDPELSGSMSTVLGDKNMVSIAKTFAFYDAEDKTSLQRDNFAENITNEFMWQQFMNSVSEVDSSIGTALQFQKSVPSLASNSISENAKWYSVLGSTLMRSVFETALGLPDGFSQIDIDKQLEMIQEKAEARFGISSFSDLEDKGVLNKIIHSYLLQDQLSPENSYGSQKIALTLLSNAT